MGRDPNPERPATIAQWEAVFGSPPPPYLSVPFMKNSLVYEAQCKASGGMPAATKRALRRIAKGGAVATSNTTSLRPGVQLVREWNGRTYQVEVIKGGFRMDGKEWASLSAIAKHITGTDWSGPRFFGLNNRAAGRS